MKVQKKLILGIIRAKLKGLSLISKRKAGEEAFRLFCTPYYKSQNPGMLLKHIERLEFVCDGKKIKGYRTTNEASKKVLLLHGFASNCHNFDHYVTALMQKGYTVMAFDAPAHGKSEGKTVNALDYSKMIKKVIQLYGQVDAFVAHSFGGLSVCLALEEIPHNDATKLVLIAPATETSTAIETAFTMLGIKGATIKKALVDYITEMSGKSPDWFSVSRAIKHLKASVLWCHDKEDDITPFSDVEPVMKQGHHHLQFHITSGLGHKKIYRDAAVKNTIISFL